MEVGRQTDELRAVHGALTSLHDGVDGGLGDGRQFHFVADLQGHGGGEGQSGFADFKAGGVVGFPAEFFDGQRLNKTMSNMLSSIGIGRITFFVATICHIKRRLAY